MFWGVEGPLLGWAACVLPHYIHRTGDNAMRRLIQVFHAADLAKGTGQRGIEWAVGTVRSISIDSVDSSGAIRLRPNVSAVGRTCLCPHPTVNKMASSGRQTESSVYSLNWRLALSRLPKYLPPGQLSGHPRLFLPLGWPFLHLHFQLGRKEPGGGSRSQHKIEKRRRNEKGGNHVIRQAHSPPKRKSPAVSAG